MDKQALKQAVCAAIDQHREKIFEIGEAIRVNPELGYKEFKTAQRVKEVFEEMGLPYQEKVALTGLIAQMKGRLWGNWMRWSAPDIPRRTQSPVRPIPAGTTPRWRRCWAWLWAFNPAAPWSIWTATFR